MSDGDDSNLSPLAGQAHFFRKLECMNPAGLVTSGTMDDKLGLGKDECNWSTSTVPNVLNEDEDEKPRRRRDARWRAERDVVQTLDYGITTPFTTFKYLLSLSHISQVTVVALYFMWVRDPSTAAIYSGDTVHTTTMLMEEHMCDFLMRHVSRNTVGFQRSSIDDERLKKNFNEFVVREFRLTFSKQDIREALYAKWSEFVKACQPYETLDAWVDLFIRNVTVGGKPVLEVGLNEREDAVCEGMGEFLVPHFDDNGDQYAYYWISSTMRLEVVALEDFCVTSRRDAQLQAENPKAYWFHIREMVRMGLLD